VKKINKKVLIRVDGYKRLGLGHVYRNLVLAQYLRKRYGWHIVFAIRNNFASRVLIEQYGFECCLIPFNTARDKEVDRLVALLDTIKPDIVIVDVINIAKDQEYILKLKERRKEKIVVFTDTHKKMAIPAHVVVNTSPYQSKKDYEPVNGTVYYVGFNYLILSEAYLKKTKRSKKREKKNRILICMGGSDHNNLTWEVLKAIDKSTRRFYCDIVMSSVYAKQTSLERMIKSLRHKVVMHNDVNGLLPLLRNADIAITAGGYTNIERMCAGVAGIVINQLRHQQRYTQWIEDRRAVLNLGFYKDIKPKMIQKALEELLDQENLSREIASNSRKLIDGQGLVRVAEALYETV